MYINKRNPSLLVAVAVAVVRWVSRELREARRGVEGRGLEEWISKWQPFAVPFAKPHVIVVYYAQICRESSKGMEMEMGIEPLPLINTDLEMGGSFPEVVEALRRKILESECIIFSSPEYNYSVSAPSKKAIDWASRPPNVWTGKPAAFVSTGGGFDGGRSQYHLRQIGVFIDIHFINKPESCLLEFQSPQKFDSDGNLIHSESKEKLEQVLLSLQAFTHRLQGKS